MGDNILKENIYKKVRDLASVNRRRIVIAEGWDEYCIQAASKILKEGIVDLVMLDDGTLLDKASSIGADISKAKIIDFRNFEGIDDMAESLVELRRKKGMTKEEALRLLSDENYFACMYVHSGFANGLVGSKICPTASLMRPAMQILRKENALVSEVMVLYHPSKDKLFFVTDASLNISPNSEELARIASNAASCVREMGYIPKIAFLSFSTKGSGGDNDKTRAVREALSKARELMPDVIMDGEMQLDAAINPYAADRKCPKSPLKGEANILVFPDLNSSNIFAHAMFQLADVEVLFTFLPGLRNPVGILGRSTPSEYVVNLIYSVAMEVNLR